MGKNKAPIDSKRSVTVRIPRRCATATEVSRRTLPVAGIDLFAVFLDRLFYQVRVLGTPTPRSFSKNRQPIHPTGFAEPMNIGGRLLQLGSWQRLQIFNDDFQRAHNNRLSATDATGKSHSGFGMSLFFEARNHCPSQTSKATTISVIMANGIVTTKASQGGKEGASLIGTRLG